MNNQIILLLIFCGVSNIFTLTMEQFKNLPGSELERIKLRSKLNEKLIEDPKAELESLEKINKSVKLFDKMKEMKEIIEETLKSIEEEKLEIETFKEFREEIKSKESIDEYVKSLESAVEGFLPRGKEAKLQGVETLEEKAGVTSKDFVSKGSNDVVAFPFDQNQVLTIKKLLFACKFLQNNICNSKDFEELTNDQTSAIKILQKDENGPFLRNLSEKAKVQVWPVNLNISRIISKYKKSSFSPEKIEDYILIEKAQNEMKSVLKNIFVKEGEGPKELEEEINFRIQFIDEFLKPEDRGTMTISWLCLKMDAFIKVIDTLMKKLELNSFKLGESDLLIVKKWLFFNQMIFAVDWATRSGKFVKPWPKGLIIGGGYEIPVIEDNAGNFSGLPKFTTKEEAEEMKEERKSMVSRVTSFFRFGSVKEPAHRTAPASTQKETKSFRSRAFDKGRSLVKGADTKLYNSLKPKNAGKEAEGNKGTLSRLFSSKKENTTKENVTSENTTKENVTKENTTPPSPSESPNTSTTKTAEAAQSKGFFKSLIPASWYSSKPATTPAQELKPKTSSWLPW